MSFRLYMVKYLVKYPIENETFTGLPQLVIDRFLPKFWSFWVDPISPLCVWGFVASCSKLVLLPPVCQWAFGPSLFGATLFLRPPRCSCEKAPLVLVVTWGFETLHPKNGEVGGPIKNDLPFWSILDICGWRSPTGLIPWSLEWMNDWLGCPRKYMNIIINKKGNTTTALKHLSNVM